MIFVAKSLRNENAKEIKSISLLTLLVNKRLYPGKENLNLMMDLLYQ